MDAWEYIETESVSLNGIPPLPKIVVFGFLDFLESPCGTIQYEGFAMYATTLVGHVRTRSCEFGIFVKQNQLFGGKNDPISLALVFPNLLETGPAALI